MSEHSLTRKVRVNVLKPNVQVPNDGQVYRDSDGESFICIHYVFKNEKERALHFWKLAQIAEHERRTKK